MSAESSVPCSASSPSAVLKFDGINCDRASRTLALSNIQSNADGNSTLLVINHFGGDFRSTVLPIGELTGVLFNDTEAAFGFSLPAGACQFISPLTGDLPQGFDGVIPSGRSGWMKLWAVKETAIMGAAIIFNRGTKVSAYAYNQGHNLHRLTLTNSAVFTIPVFPPSC